MFELLVELSGERLIVGEDERWALELLDHMGHGEGLARAGNAQQYLGVLPRPRLRHKLFNGLRLVASRSKIRKELEGHMFLITHLFPQDFKI